ncbi:hypothetical protein [Amycolatopsis kentuckyensis]|uniref:hypothetical protein n=1 Tax=Amycolatopsis kentuckyensis TaxID=218823 RepID=UPI000A36FB9F|nr:hypothetical protein [Amycolatopsis kentuckyensis]
MTTQESDEVRFGGKRFAITAVDGTGLFDPAAHGLELRAMHTGCWRGHVARYVVVDGRLVLRDLHVGAADTPPPLDRVRPRWRAMDHAWHYTKLNLATEFSGRLLLGHGRFPERPYLNMGFRPAWVFTDVRELTFRDGTLLAAEDLSSELDAVRAVAPARPGAGEPADDWIDRTFSLSYAYSWPGH